MLECDPNKRITAADIVKEPWLQDQEKSKEWGYFNQRLLINHVSEKEKEKFNKMLARRNWL